LNAATQQQCHKLALLRFIMKNGVHAQFSKEGSQAQFSKKGVQALLSKGGISFLVDCSEELLIVLRGRQL
jgi:hypothetical protein